MYEWLIESRHKLTLAEYVLCLATFCLILVFNVEYGIIIGAILYAICKKYGLDLGAADLPINRDGVDEVGTESNAVASTDSNGNNSESKKYGSM